MPPPDPSLPPPMTDPPPPIPIPNREQPGGPQPIDDPAIKRRGSRRADRSNSASIAPAVRAPDVAERASFRVILAKLDPPAPCLSAVLATAQIMSEERYAPLWG
jgi:hypothetical protein